jgi:hypothetical protein
VLREEREEHEARLKRKESLKLAHNVAKCS